jgi:hypothetical protein
MSLFKKKKNTVSKTEILQFDLLQASSNENEKDLVVSVNHHQDSRRVDVQDAEQSLSRDVSRAGRSASPCLPLIQFLRALLLLRTTREAIISSTPSPVGCSPFHSYPSVLQLHHGPLNGLLPGRIAPRAGASRAPSLRPAPPPAPGPARHRPMLRRRRQVSSSILPGRGHECVPFINY